MAIDAGNEPDSDSHPIHLVKRKGKVKVLEAEIDGKNFQQLYMLFDIKPMDLLHFFVWARLQYA